MVRIVIGESRVILSGVQFKATLLVVVRGTEALERQRRLLYTLVGRWWAICPSASVKT